MANPIYEQNPVRLELSPLISPPRGLLDRSTLDEPQLWRATPAAIQVGIFDPQNVAVDLSNLVGLQLVLQKGPMSPVALITKSVLAVNITPTIARSAWLDQTGQQVQFDLSGADLDLGLDAQPSAEFWLSIIGTTIESKRIVYGAGFVRVYIPSNQLTTPMPGIVSANKQICSDTTAVIVQALSLFHTEEVTFTGAATVRNVLVQTAGLVAGQPITIIAIFDAQAVNGMTINFRLNNGGGPIQYTFTRNDDESNGRFVLTADGIGGFIRVEQTVPAF